jgi:hypothetical protein
LGRTDFLNWFEAENSEKLAEKLCQSYQVNGQTAWNLLRIAEKFDVRILTSLTEAETGRMRLRKFDSLDRAVSETGENAKGYILASGAKVLIKIGNSKASD